MTAVVSLPRMRDWGVERREKFAARMRELRLLAGLSQKDFAEKVGVAQSRVSQWESATNTPLATILPAIAEALGVSMEALFDEPGPNVPMPQRGRPPKPPADDDDEPPAKRKPPFRAS